MTDENVWKSRLQFAAQIGRTERTERRLRESGKGPEYYRHGSQIRYRVTDIDAWIETKRVVGKVG